MTDSCNTNRLQCLLASHSRPRAVVVPCEGAKGGLVVQRVEGAHNTEQVRAVAQAVDEPARKAG